ncbi:hypothetical protein RvY_10947 [Ramazzottius varieornatus]|uniref:Uncharacterized protein n=1 Tax=Ramazzottius varieornatus TaxID=947166 RepID=A0A1D1VM96_RAMVA|nr:hypothetical protein RvY_10947 [Ramazzottius varieornatus]
MYQTIEEKIRLLLASPPEFLIRKENQRSRDQKSDRMHKKAHTSMDRSIRNSIQSD